MKNKTKDGVASCENPPKNHKKMRSGAPWVTGIQERKEIEKEAEAVFEVRMIKNSSKLKSDILSQSQEAQKMPNMITDFPEKKEKSPQQTQSYNI